MNLRACMVATTLAIVASVLIASVQRARAECLFGPQQVLHELAATAVTPHVVLQPDYLTIDTRRISACEGLPGVHPSAVAIYSNGIVVGFRDGSLATTVDRGASWQTRRGPGGHIRAMVSDDDALWIGTSDGLYRGTRLADGSLAYARSRFFRHGVVSMSLPSDVLEVEAEPSGHWLARANGNFVRTSDAAWSLSASPLVASATGLPSSHITALAHATSVGANVVAVGTFDQGAILLDLVTRQARPIDGTRYCNALLQHPNGKLYVGGADGLFVVSHVGSLARIQSQPVALGFANVHVTSLHVSRSGELYVGTNRGLFVQSNGGETRHLTRQSGLPSDQVWAVSQANDGRVWVGTSRGAVALARDSQALALYSHANGTLGDDWVTALLPTPRGMLIGTYAGGITETIGSDTITLSWGRDLWVNPQGLFANGNQVVVATLGTGLIAAGQRRAQVPASMNDITSYLRVETGELIGTRNGLVMLPAQ